MKGRRPNEKVKVVVRCRPMNDKEIKSGFNNIVDIFPDNNTIRITNPLEGETISKRFTFDAVYDSSTTQEHLYRESVQPVINSVLNGFNGTIFAYGQTGTGKTFTMEGNHLQPTKRGIIPKSFDQIFNHISQSKNLQYLVRTSYIEIYQEQVKDLLDDSGENYHELAGNGSGIYIKNLKSHLCKNAEEMANVMKHGKRNRKVAATDMNEFSSRSHAIFIITIEMSQMIAGVNHVKVGKLNLVDLAGSERQVKSCTAGKRLKEARKINLSLSALGNVISALSNGRNFHVPYRDSKLTRLLQDSLGGNSKTLMIATIGPASYNYTESLTTLRYANRAKNIKNKPIINEDPKDALIKEYQDEINRLKALVQARRNLGIKPKCEKADNETLLNENEVNTNKLNNIQLLERGTLSDDEKMVQMKQHTALQETTQNIDILEQRIQSMESRILKGTNIVEHTNKQQEILQQHAEEIKERKKHKLELEQLLEKEEETTEELQDSHITLQQDIERKSRTLSKLYSKLQGIQMLIADTTEEFNMDRNKLELARNELIKEYKLNQIIIENFIAASDRQNFMKKVFYDDEDQKWKTNKYFNTTIQRNFSTLHQRRAESEYSRVLGKLDYSTRFKGENIINLEMEQPQRSTNNYKCSTVKYALEKALKTEADITVDASSTQINHLLKEDSTFSNAPQNSEFQKKYPKVRGLVKRK